MPSKYTRNVAPNYGARAKAAAAALGSNDVERGLAAGKGIGEALQGLGSTIGGAIQQSKQDAVANSLMNAQPTATANAQALADPDPDPLSTGEDNLNPTAFTDPSGTQDPTPFTGGVAELKAQQDFQKEQLDTELKKAKLADYVASTQGTGSYAKPAIPVKSGVTVGGGSSSRWLEGDTGGNQTGYNQTGQRGGSKSGKPPPYVAGSVDAENDTTADDMNIVSADFDAAMGGKKGSYANFMANLPNVKPDENGNYVLKDRNDNVTGTVLKQDAPYWLNRTNAARRRQGLTPVAFPGLPFGAGANPTSTIEAGKDASNPIVLTSNLHVRSLPYGTYVKDPTTGAISRIDKPRAQ